MQKTRIIPGQFLESGKNSTVVFDFIEKAFNQMTLLLNKPITGTGLFTVAARRDHHLNSLVLKGFNERIAVIAFIRRQFLYPFRWCKRQ